MKTLVKENAVFFGWCAVFFAAGIVLLLQIEQGDEIIFFSERRTEFWNLFFKNATQLGEFWVFVVVILPVLYFNRRAGVSMTAMGLSVSLVSYLLKIFFAHPRPKTYFRERELLENLSFVEGVYVNAGATSLPSGHTMAAFALFGFLSFLAQKKPLTGTLLFALALAVGVSRMYLVQHFLKDVLFGAALGLALAIIAWWVYEKQPKVAAQA